MTLLVRLRRWGGRATPDAMCDPPTGPDEGAPELQDARGRSARAGSAHRPGRSPRSSAVSGIA